MSKIKLGTKYTKDNYITDTMEQMLEQGLEADYETVSWVVDMLEKEGFIVIDFDDENLQ